jgi:hypothetical protein
MITSAENERWPSDVAIADHARGFAGAVGGAAGKKRLHRPGRIDRPVGRFDKAAAQSVGQKLRGFLG